ncbi:MAG: hypothetical protein GY862_24265 [Gammaproteobacteria bacterium]|nr:hypothetical protein [Gammaproteobacteria bacterium]
MKLSHDLQQQIVDFLTSIPNIQESKQQQTLIFSAGLDQRLQGQMDFSSAPAQFVPVLVETLLKYGNLEDGRHALAAVLEAAKQYVGQNRQAECDELLRQFQTRRVASEGTSAEKPHIDPHWHLKIDRISQRDSLLPLYLFLTKLPG